MPQNATIFNKYLVFALKSVFTFNQRQVFMIYTSLLCGVLAVYALFLNRRLTVLKKNLKELLQENERQTTQNSPTLSDIYFKVDRV